MEKIMTSELATLCRGENHSGSMQHINQREEMVLFVCVWLFGFGSESVELFPLIIFQRHFYYVFNIHLKLIYGIIMSASYFLPKPRSHSPTLLPLRERNPLQEINEDIPKGSAGCRVKCSLIVCWYEGSLTSFSSLVIDLLSCTRGREEETEKKRRGRRRWQKEWFWSFHSKADLWYNANSKK